MFWRFGGFANISTIDTILDKPDFTLEDLLEETDLIQELKQHNAKLIEYLREDAVLQKLLEYVVAPKLEVIETPPDDVSSTIAASTSPSSSADDSAKTATNPDAEDAKTTTAQSSSSSNKTSSSSSGLLSFGSRPRASSRTTDVTDTDEEEQEKKRNRFAFVACEILSSDTWSIYEALTENKDLIRSFWKFIANPAPLDPLQASYFTKVNESLFEKKTEEMMDLLRELPDSVPNLLKHVECPMIMDLLLKIIALDRNEGGQGIVEWLYSKDIIPTLLSCLGSENSWVVQTAAGDFIKAIITISANASQNEQQCIGPNELTRQLVSRECVEQLIGYMLKGGNPLTVGVGIVIEVIRKNNSDYDPEVGSETNSPPSSRDPIYLGTLLRLFADHVPKFTSLVMDGPVPRQTSESTFGERLAPLGFDRFKTCELMAELLHCSNMGLLNEAGAEQVIATRDIQRQQLRAEGHLASGKGENASDELTMRRSHPSSDESRRLEVTNADDDGFEEVEPSREMSEDTSHEFVKAEEEEDVAQQTSSSAFLDNSDQDEFVDEPLSSSPQMAVATDKVQEQQFEEPDLVVAPLSPTKQKPAEPILTNNPATGYHSKSPEPGQLPQHGDLHAKPEGNTKESESGSTTVFTPASSDQPAITVNKDEHADESAESSKTGRNFSPHAEDTPAPLFSTSATATSADQPSRSSNNQSTLSQDDTMGTSPEEEPQPTDVSSSSEAPVVGDYLKMQFVEHSVVPTILTFFFKYPWNNFLHNVVYDIVQQVFNGPMDRSYNPTLAVSLFEDANVTLAIIEGQKASDESQAKTKTRMGYMGHLTLIAEEVVKFTERHPPELLSEKVLDRVMSQEWINYVEGALAETRERDNAILGGVRPDMAGGPRGSMDAGAGLGGLSGVGGGSGGGSNALADAGLNGGMELSNDNGNNGIGPFAISAGTMMSGFGSSSDEDDDDVEGDDDEGNQESRGYHDSNPADPPFAPPAPPPPLNIPPSRARRQLAARLAMHQKQKQDNGSSSGNDAPGDGGSVSRTSLLADDVSRQPSSLALHLPSDDDDEEDEHDDGTDPFADVDEDIEDDEDLAEAGGFEHRGAWWRHVGQGGDSDDDDDEAEEDVGGHRGGGQGQPGGGGDDDDEFGDFATAGDHDADDAASKRGEEGGGRSTGGGLSSLWPFGGASGRGGGGGGESDQDGSKVPEVKEAKRRVSIEEADADDDDDDCAEIMAGAR